MKKFMLLTVALIALSAQTAMSRPIPEVQKFLNAEIGRLSAVMDETGTYDEYPSVGEMFLDSKSSYSFDFAQFALRVRAPIGFDVYFGKIELIPEIELFWKE